MHGGALIFGSRNGTMRPLHASLLDQGYVIVSIDYRLAPETKLPAIIGDVRDAWKWMHEQARRFGIDRGRIATGGASAGGYLAQMTGFCLNSGPRALVSYFGYGDIVGPWYSQPDEFYRRRPLVSKEDALAAVGIAPISDPPQGNQRDKFYLYYIAGKTDFGLRKFPDTTRRPRTNGSSRTARSAMSRRNIRPPC
jgi:hypothetical protein